jgi:D-alanine-D-alanine ligase
VGSGCAASAVALDKLRTRQTLADAGIPIARAYVPRTPLAKADAELEFARMQQAIGAPAFVKGDLSGSTVGVQRIESAADLAAFFAAFRGTFRRWFAEEALVGEEITVPVLGNTGDELRPLLPVGIYPRTATWFTHEAKYQPGATDETVPPRGWGEPRIRHVQELAMRCHEALVCDGMSRTDMIVTKDGPHVLETNTIPGMTTTSLLPQSAAKCGLPFPKLLDTLIGHALARAGAVRPRPAPASTVTPGEAVADA